MNLPSCRELENYLHKNIPLSKSMGISFQKLSLSEVVLKVPFKPNINHISTVFGGSLNAALTLSCWSLVYINLYPDIYDIVITHNEASYIKPVCDDFEASCRLDGQNFSHFIKTLKRKGKARINLKAVVGDFRNPSVKFEGVFAALVKK